MSQSESLFEGHARIIIKKSCKSCDLQDSVRRERDSNPRYLSVRRFSRPVHSTTLPSLHGVCMVGRVEISKAPECFGTYSFTTYSGERGIRTPGTSQYAGFQDRCIRPLCHLSMGCWNPVDVVLLHAATHSVVLLICGCKGSAFFLFCKLIGTFFY